jgi:hypothetical protein
VRAAPLCCPAVQLSERGGGGGGGGGGASCCCCCCHRCVDQCWVRALTSADCFSHPRFAWQRQLEHADPDEIYKLFVDMQQEGAKKDVFMQLGLQEADESLPKMLGVMDIEQFALRSGWLHLEERRKQVRNEVFGMA